MPFERPTVTELVDRISGDIETRLPDVGSLLRRSVLKVLARVFAGAVHLTYGFLAYAKDQLFITTADSNYLDVHGNEYGITRQAATKATGNVTATGTVGTLIPSGSELSSGSGIAYVTNTDYTIGLGGSVTMIVEAVEAGSDGNEDAGSEISFVSPISGIDSAATVTTGGLTGGADQESDNNYRARVLNRKRRVPHGGCEHDLIAWMLEIAGVTRAWAFSLYNGVGTVAVTFVRDGEASIVPSVADIAEMENYLIQHDDPATGETVGVPVTMYPGLTVLPLTTRTIDISIAVYPNTATVRTAIETALENWLLLDGGPGQTLYLSRISEAISSAAGEMRNRIVSPTADIVCGYTEVPILGSLTWSNY